jgi:uncharacterized protein YprB with RNaseH-like and TPR domain
MSLLEAGTLRDRLGELARSRRANVLRPVDESSAGTASVDEHAFANPERTIDVHGDRTASSVHDATTAMVRSAAASRGPSAYTSPGAVGVEEFLPGGEWRDDRGSVYVHERLRSELEARARHWGALGEPPEEETALLALREAGLSKALFLDLETGGFISSPVFLAGTMHWNGTDFVLRQYFARHYGEEAGLLRALAQAAQGFEFLVTFNGKSYDAPFLSSRAVVHGVALELPGFHVDLLHPSRRRWKGRLSDCRLQTLEMAVCRRRRSGDVPSEEVPSLYHDFVRRGDPYRLIPVFHHNLLDVITMGEILHALCSPPLPERSLWTRRLEPTNDWLF